jgi:glycerate dehydrogenase
MPSKPAAVFLDFATIGSGVDTSGLDDLARVRYYDFSEANELAGRLARCEIALTNKTRLGQSVINGASALRLIAVSATGTDNVDSAAAKKAGVAVTNVRDYCSDGLAQHVFALILGLTQQIGPYTKLVRSGAWSTSRSFALLDFPIRELAGRNLGIIGYGSLGQAVARAGEGFGMNILISQRPGTEGPPPPNRVPLDRVLSESDVLSLHCPLTDATRHLLNAPAFQRMKKDAVVINTARGALIDQRALAEALRTGEIGGAGIDVLPTEPPPVDDPLLAPDIPNLVLTPHIAWAATEARQRVIDQVAENIRSFYEGGDLRRVV